MALKFDGHETAASTTSSFTQKYTANTDSSNNEIHWFAGVCLGSIAGDKCLSCYIVYGKSLLIFISMPGYQIFCDIYWA